MVTLVPLVLAAAHTAFRIRRQASRLGEPSVAVRLAVAAAHQHNFPIIGRNSDVRCSLLALRRFR